ncbi:MAG: HU family DNA-binding protein [Erysipelotrichaceae bacterium]|nr:HU family DNA-binding protein [Erysipelotrichaceae bacterium]
MNKLDLTEQLVAKTGLTRKEAEEVVAAALKLIADHLVKGEIVKLTDFGTFSVKTRKARNGTNPKTGKKIKIPAKRTVTFKLSKKLKAKINK